MPRDFTPSELELIRSQCFPANGSAAEWNACIAVACELELNPILKEVHFMPRRQKQGDQWLTRVEPLVGRDGFLSIAHRTGQFAGVESTAEVVASPRLVEGKWENHPDLVATCTVWRKDCDKPFIVNVSFAEYVQQSNDGKPTRFWAEKPATMLKKVAESQALRKAFNVHGVYAPEELGVGIESGGEILVEAETQVTGKRRSDPPAKEGSRPATSATATAPKTVLSAPVKSAPFPEAPPVPLAIDPVKAIFAACHAKGVAIERKGEMLVARSYTHRDFLKAQGFRWDGSARCWSWQPLPAAA